MTNDVTTATRPGRTRTTTTRRPAGAAVGAGPRAGADGARAPPPADPIASARRPACPAPVVAWHARGRHARAELADAGMATAEYAIATLAAVGFAGLLVVILKGNEVKGLLMGIIRQALSL